MSCITKLNEEFYQDYYERWKKERFNQQGEVNEVEA
jgi:hypothetical protein